MSPHEFLSLCTTLAMGILCLSLLAAAARVLMGPTLPDRVLALDMLVAIAVGFIAILGIRTGQGFHVDIAISLGLVGFLATVAFARFILSRSADDAMDVGNPDDGGRT